MGFAGKFVSEVPEGVFDGAEEFVIGEFDQFIRHALQDGIGITTQGGEDLLATVFALLSGLVRGGGGFIRHGNLPGVNSSVSLKQREQFPTLDSN
jgi:hypothetical protein